MRGRDRDRSGNGIGMEYVVAGPAEARPVLLIHGLGWDAGGSGPGCFPALAEAGFRALRRTCAVSAGPRRPTPPTRPTSTRRDLEAFLDAFGIDRLPVVGFSMGASIAGALGGRSSGVSASAWPAAACTGPRPGGAGSRICWRGPKRSGPSPSPPNRPRRSFAPPGRRRTPTRSRISGHGARRWTRIALFRAFRSGYGADFRAAVRGAGVPTQVIAADTDAFCELDDMRAMAEAIPGARFDVIGACGHMATIEQLEAFNACWLDFCKMRCPHEDRSGHRLRALRRAAGQPGADLLGRVDGAVIGGVTIRTAQIPVSRARLPG
jgi:pimeloyl-ACP methyl ester carboxylesterase